MTDRPTPALIATLDDLARQRRIRLLRRPTALGFPASANAGILAAKGRDVVLLNSDTLVPPDGWSGCGRRLQRARHRHRDAAFERCQHSELPGRCGDESAPRPGRDQPAGPVAGGRTAPVLSTSRSASAFAYTCAATVSNLSVYCARTFSPRDTVRKTILSAWPSTGMASSMSRSPVCSSGIMAASASARAPAPQARNARLIEQLHPGYDRLIARFIEPGPVGRRPSADRSGALASSGRGCADVVLITHDQAAGSSLRLPRQHVLTPRRDAGRSCCDRPNAPTGIAR